MALVKCLMGHYYDETKFDSCPFCDGNDGAEINMQKTVSGRTFSEDIKNVQRTQMYADNGGENDKTIGVFSKLSGNDYTTGWLVETEGMSKGRSCELHHGRNFVGRKSNMDIRIAEDKTVTRENHFSVIYDDKANRFYLTAGGGITFHNGEFLRNSCELKDGDEIAVGKTKFIFVAFCKDGRNWK